MTEHLFTLMKWEATFVDKKDKMIPTSNTLLWPINLLQTSSTSAQFLCHSPLMLNSPTFLQRASLDISHISCESKQNSEGLPAK